MLTKDNARKALFEASLYLWDYFYLSNAPVESERRAWRRIECATIRIRDSEQLLCEDYPPAVRVKNAKRVRRAVREIVRLSSEALETVPDTKMALTLGMLEGHAQRIIDAHADEAAAQPLN